MPVAPFEPVRIQKSRPLRAGLIASIGALACLAPGSGLAAGCPARGEAAADCGQHNMMVVGEQTVFASHLPMFHSPHRFQVILEVDLSKAGQARNAVYAADRKAHPNVGMYTLEPQEKFVLADMFRGDPKARRTSFRGTVYRGHLERGGIPLDQLTGVNVRAKRVVYAQEIGPSGGLSRADSLQYIVFGRGAEMFLAHRITGAPDFDQLLSVKITGHAFTEDELQRGVLVTAPDRANTAARRLHRGETVAVSGHVTGAHQFLPLKVRVVGEPYFEEGELAARPVFEPTPLETEAGFSG